MTDKAAKIRSIFYSSAILGMGVYGMNPIAHNCSHLRLSNILAFCAFGIALLVAAEAAAAYHDQSKDFLKAFDEHSGFYEDELDDSALNSLKKLFDLDDEYNNLVINENISTKLNGKEYFVSDVNAYFKSGGNFSGLVLTAPIEISSNHIIAGGSQNSLSGINITKYSYSETCENLAVFNEKGDTKNSVPSEVLAIINNLRNELGAETVNCLISNNTLQIAVKSAKSYKDSSDAIYSALCNLSLRNIDKGAVHERVKINQQVHQIKELR